MAHRFDPPRRQTNSSTDSTDSTETDGENRRRETKRTTGAAAVLVVGSSSSIDGGRVSADESESEDATSTSDDESEAANDAEPELLDRPLLVSMDDYQPGISVRVVDRLPAPITVQLLRPPDGETIAVLERPDEYAGYVARDETDDAVRTTTILFTRDSLETDAEYALEPDAQVFSTQLRLFESQARRVDAD
ncbi:hypothetical protein [Natronorubrum daqingense]|uniref:Uncharacterized protein n=1 Tax=Natronorubrum daqingense TaxID=588898 RepID=A0A1N7EW65_9EURY|nr:hypothetical protein [Natronorubrum daqingense]APX97683.1 hypothetical protein BB347_14270 [Natronorubrum daqingense]SIR92175.1 hypothetical protein SAMN05421809_2899 [Natronorubrum daqingense]